jgi:replication factor C small subunit
VPLFFGPVEQEIMFGHLHQIRHLEAAGQNPCSDDDLDLIVQAAAGDMRRAILLLQAAVESGKCQDLFAVAQSETANVAGAALLALKDGDVRGAIRRFEALMIDYGLSGREVLAEIRLITQREYNHPVLSIALADAEYRMHHSNNEFVQTGAFATSIREVFL